jgi:hypothetical protein
MKKTVVYLDKNIKAANARYLTHNIPNVEYRELAYDKLIIPHKTDQVVLHGVLRGNKEIIQQAMQKDIDWIMMDNGYLGTYKRIVKNATAPISFRKGKRFEHNTKLEPWKGGQGKHILVLPPSPPYMETFGISNFLNHIAHTANIFTDKPIVMRAKPAKGKKAPPLEEQLKDAYCVITWGSAVALEASRLGVPTISLGWCPAKHVSYKLQDLETQSLLEEPDRMGMFDNLTWSSFEKNELETAWKFIEENDNTAEYYYPAPVNLNTYDL